MVVQFCGTKSKHNAEKSIIVQNPNYDAEKYAKKMHILNKKVLFSEMLSIWCRLRDVVAVGAVIDIVDVVVFKSFKALSSENSSHIFFLSDRYTD